MVVVVRLLRSAHEALVILWGHGVLRCWRQDPGSFQRITCFCQDIYISLGFIEGRDFNSASQCFYRLCCLAVNDGWIEVRQEKDKKEKVLSEWWVILHCFY